MGRNRGTRRDNALPEYVYRVPGRDRVIWREYLGQGKFGRKVTLQDDRGRALPADASHQRILAAYQRQVAAGRGERTLSWLLERYLASPRYDELHSRTRDHYRRYAETIAQRPTSSGAAFGAVPLRKVTRGAVAKYKDKRAQEARTAAVREIQFLRAVFSWAVEREYMESNPARDVQLTHNKARTRYVQDWEFDLVQAYASDYVAVAMELAYLLRARRAEVLGLRREDLLDEGVYLRRAKESESEVTTWTPRLEETIKAAKAINRDVISPWLLHGPDGDPVKVEAFTSAWRRAMDKARKAGLRETFTFHDLKAKGISDHANNHGGHRSERMRDVYVRLAQRVESTR